MIPNKAKYVATTPKSITPEVKAFCESLSNEEPLYLNITDDVFAKTARCYLNANNLAEWMDGEMVFGWAIWEMPGIYLTAEHHAVAEVDEELIDVTPQFNREKRILFLPDRITEFTPPRPANRYTALSNDPRIKQFIQLKLRTARLDRDQNYSPEFLRSENAATALLDSFFASREQSKIRTIRRKQRKAERKRKKKNRR